MWALLAGLAKLTKSGYLFAVSPWPNTQRSTLEMEIGPWYNIRH
jgi:hypothetical protein